MTGNVKDANNVKRITQTWTGRQYYDAFYSNEKYTYPNITLNTDYVDVGYNEYNSSGIFLKFPVPIKQILSFSVTGIAYNGTNATTTSLDNTVILYANSSYKVVKTSPRLLNQYAYCELTYLQSSSGSYSPPSLITASSWNIDFFTDSENFYSKKAFDQARLYIGIDSTQYNGYVRLNSVTCTYIG